MLQMAKILHIDEYNLLVTVEAGITWRELLMFLERVGLTLPVYPSSAAAATVGGFVASGGVGIGSAKYGNIKDQVVGIEVVLPNGLLARTGKVVLSGEDQLAEDSERGMDWLNAKLGQDDDTKDIDPHQLFMETYGVFGFITKVTLRLIPKLMFRSFACSFEDISSMVAAAAEITAKVNPYHLRYLTDTYSSKLLSLRIRKAEFGKFILSGALLDIVYEVEDAVEKIESIVEAHNGILLDNNRSQFYWRERLYPLRIKSLGPSLVPAEAILPLKSIPEMFEDTSKALRNSNAAIEGTISRDGAASFLVWILDDERKKIAYTLGWYRSFDLARLAKTHGGKPYAVALWNVPFADEFYGTPYLRKLKSAKRSIDPENLVNPTKVFGGRVKAAKESLAFGFLSGFAVLVILQAFGPQFLGWTWLSTLLWNPIIPSIPLPIAFFLGILGGIIGFLFIRILSLSTALKLGIPLLRGFSRLLRLK